MSDDPVTKQSVGRDENRADIQAPASPRSPASPDILQGWARAVDYLLGRNTLIGMASLMLLLISTYATWNGMSDFILGVSQTSPAGVPGAQPGRPASDELLVIAIVVALSFLMWLALRESFGKGRTLRERMLTLPLYLFLALWSIGFGYGFWWSLIAGEDATRTSLARLQEDARNAASLIAARLTAVQAQLDSVVAWSDAQMAREESSGGSCGVKSGAGKGPLYNARLTVRDSVVSLRDNMMKTWFQPLQQEIQKLRHTVLDLDGGSIEQRQRNFEARAAAIRETASSIAARSNALGQSAAAEMRALAAAVLVPPNKPGFSCYDPTLAQRLTQAADQADQPVVLKLPEAAFNEGPAGVATAVKNLWSKIGASISRLIRSALSGGSSSPDEATGTPLTGRDLIALLATLGVDLGLFALTALNPPVAEARESGLADSRARLKLPTAAVTRQLSGAIRTAISRAPGTDLEWVRRHLVHHCGRSYFVIPNLFSASDDKQEELRALAINQLAGILDDLHLVQALSRKELKQFAREENRPSLTDLTPYKHQKQQAGANMPAAAASGWFSKLLSRGTGGQTPGYVQGQMRNHGLLSKAQRALDIAGWSDAAQRDFELYKLVDTEGLTPLLTLLSQASLDQGDQGQAEQQQARKLLSYHDEATKA